MHHSNIKQAHILTDWPPVLCAGFEGAGFEGAGFEGASFAGAGFEGAGFEGAALQTCIKW